VCVKNKEFENAHIGRVNLHVRKSWLFDYIWEGIKVKDEICWENKE
jgi:hypothetical protein